MRSRPIPLLLLLSILLLPAACGGRAVSSGALVVGIEAAPTSLDPRYATDAVSERINGLIYSGLVRLDAKGRVVPGLARSWEIPDPRTYRFHLRRNVSFHDGTPLTAADIRFTFESILDPATASPHRSTFEKIERIETPDPWTVIFILKEPFAPFLVGLTMGIVPARTARRLGKGFAEHPVGTGPFMLVHREEGDSYTLKADPDYFGGPPKLEKVVFRVIPDSTVRFLELRKGSVQLLLNGIEPDYLPLVRRNPELRTLTGPGVNYSYIGFNLTDPILKHRRVREAIAHAVDRKAIIRYLLKGTAREATGLLSPLNWAYNGSVKTFDYDPAKSRALLDKAGFTDPDGAGPKMRFTLTFKTSQDELRKRIAAALQQQFRKVGIGMTIRSYEWGTFYGDIKSGNFQLYTLSWVGITEPDIYYYIFHSSNIPPRGANRGRYKNPEIDRLLEAGRRETDPAKRKRIYGRVQEILARDLPYVSLWYYDNVAVFSKRLHGFVLDPRGDLFSLKDAWIAK
ncbi:MAG: ABC transporter substrate-binding protein [Deltaproteobacteria bacterium]|nr:ABC transporter substrate-binding protein [Deltaproteobacteria bacterium]